MEVALLLSYHRARIQAGLAGVTRLETQGDKIRIWKGLELEMVGTKLPRLTGSLAAHKLHQIEQWL
jgi:hypothetical protein